MLKKHADTEKAKSFIESLVKADIKVESIPILESLTHYYESADEREREMIRNEVFNKKANLKLLSFSELLATLSYNARKEEYVKQALVLHSIENFSWDPRENLIYLAVIWYVINYLKLDPNKLFQSIIKISSEQASYHLKEFLERPKYLKTLKAMGLKADIKDATVKFEMDTPSWQK